MRTTFPRGVLLVVSLILVLSWSSLGQTIAAGPSPSVPRGEAGALQAATDGFVQLIGQSGGAATAVAVRGTYAYVGCGPRLCVADVSDPAHLTTVGTSQILAGLAQGIGLGGDYAYVAAGAGGVAVVRVADPTHPTVIGGFSTGRFARKVAVVGNYAFATAAVYVGTPPGGGLQILDVSDPAHAQEVAWYAASYSSYDGVAAAGQWVYYAANILRVLDVSDPPNPTLAASYSASTLVGDVQVVGSHAYVAVRSGLRILDVSDPTHPVEIGGYDASGHGTPSVVRLAVDGNLIYLADENDHLYVVNVADPAHPVAAGYYSTPQYTWDLTAAGGRVYLAKDRAHYTATHFLGGDIHILSAADPAHLAEVGLYIGWGSAEGLGVSDNHAYVTDRNGVHIVDVSVPAAPAVASFVDTENAYDAAGADSYAYVADGTAGLRVLNVSDPAHPSQAGLYDTPGEATRMVQVGNYAYVVDYNLGLRIIHVADPAHPTAVGFFGATTPRDVVVVGHYAYLAVQNGLHIVDVTDPAQPVGVSYTGIAYCRRLAVDGDYAYITVYGNVSGLRIFDIHDPAHPTQVALYQKGAPWGVAAGRGLAYVGQSTILRVLDVTDPAVPVEAGSITLPDTIYDIKLAGPLVYAASARGGLYVLRYVQPYGIYLPRIVRNSGG